MGSDPVAVVNERKQSALAALGAAAGETSLCALSRSGTPYPAVKYHEGAVSALSEAARALNRDGDAPATVATVRADWARRSTGALAATPEWAAYYAGALDALDDLVTALTKSPDPRRL